MDNAEDIPTGFVLQKVKTEPSKVEVHVDHDDINGTNRTNMLDGMASK
jgi:hypothetical protein